MLKTEWKKPFWTSSKRFIFYFTWEMFIDLEFQIHERRLLSFFIFEVRHLNFVIFCSFSIIKGLLRGKCSQSANNKKKRFPLRTLLFHSWPFFMCWQKSSANFNFLLRARYSTAILQPLESEAGRQGFGKLLIEFVAP